MKAPKSAKTWLAATLAVGLVLAVALQWFGARLGRQNVSGLQSTGVVPTELPGWLVTDRPVAGSEEEKAKVDELLNYDDAVFRIYEQGSMGFSVYIAHWSPGKMSPRLVAGHTPDVCWPAAGWVRQPEAERTPAGNAPADEIARIEDKVGLRHGQFRIFDGHDVRQNVLFWHLFGEDLVNYDTGNSPPWYAMFVDLMKHGLNQRREQWFVRISSTGSLKSLGEDPGFQKFLQSLAVIGLKAGNQPTLKP